MEEDFRFNFVSDKGSRRIYQQYHLLPQPLVGLTLTGCQEAPSSPESVEAPQASQTWQTSTPWAFSGHKPDETQEEAVARLKASSGVMEQCHDIAQKASDWREAHALTQQILASSDAPVYYREQMVALWMLRQHLLPVENSSPELMETVGQYTDMLVRHKNPEGTLIVSALERLEGHWPEERRAEAATQAAVGVAKFVEVRGNNPARAASTIDERVGTNMAEQASGHMAQLESALVDLRRMSKL